jgi:aryl-alcohol dehydrogenase-like predicted oxidoreductase
MQLRELGTTGLSVSEIGFGSWPLGNGAFDYGAVDEKDALTALSAFFGQGGNFVDTAPAYGERSERLVGESIRQFGSRESLVIATKTMGGVSFETLPDIRADAESSLKALGTDYIDILQLHQPPEEQQLMEEALAELGKLKQEGKIRFIGASIKGPNVTQSTEGLCRRYIESGQVDCIQVVYSVLRQKLAPVIDHAKSCGIGVIARTTLESGFLTDSFASLCTVPAYSAPDQRSRYPHDRLEQILTLCRRFKQLCDGQLGPGHTSQAAIAFVLANASLSSIILGTRTANHVRHNIASSRLSPLPDPFMDILLGEFGDLTEKANYY